MEKPIYSRCGMRCDLCLMYRPNVEKQDRREELCAVFRKVFPGFNPDPRTIICDSCRNAGAKGAVLFEQDCGVHRCVAGKGLEHCGYCAQYPCDIFPAEPGDDELAQTIDVECRWTWEEEALMKAYRCKAHMDAFRRHARQAGYLSI